MAINSIVVHVFKIFSNLARLYFDFFFFPRSRHCTPQLFMYIIFTYYFFNISKRKFRFLVRKRDAQMRYTSAGLIPRGITFSCFAVAARRLAASRRAEQAEFE